MSQTRLFRLGTNVSCTDGECGTLKSVVVNRGDDVVTHLVVESAHRRQPGRIVPLRLVRTPPSGAAPSGAAPSGAVVMGEVQLDRILLDCTVAEFERLDPAEATYLSPTSDDIPIRPGGSMASWPYYAPPGVMGGPGLPDEPGDAAEATTVDTVPDQLPGEEEEYRGEHVHATDGDIGEVQGIAVDPGTGRVTFVHLRMGRLWRRKAVFIPRSAVADVGADGFHLNITRQQVHDLPPADVDRLPG